MRICAVIAYFVTLVIMIHGNHKAPITPHSECQADPKTSVNDEVLHKVRGGENTEEAKAHILCVTTKLGLLGEDGKVNKAKVKEEFAESFPDAAKLDEAVAKCAVEKENPGDTALALDDCFRDAIGRSSHAHHHHN